MRKEHQRLVISLLISTLIFTVLLVRTVTPETVEAVRSMHAANLLLILFVWLIDYTSDSVSIWLLSKESSTGSISLRAAWGLTGLRNFFNVTTPFNSGGTPAVVYALGKHDIPYGEGLSISLVRMFGISAWYFLFSLISAVMLFSRALHTNSVIFLGIGVFVLLAALVYILIFLSCIQAKPLIVMSKGIYLIGKKTRFFKADQVRRRILHEAFTVRRSIKAYFSRKKTLFLLAMGANCLAAAAQITLMVIILYALGISQEQTIDLFIRSSLLIFLMRFMPSPGGIGFAEGLYILLFADVVPIHMLGAAVLIWRVFLNYSKAAVGAVVFSSIYTR